MSYWSYRSYRGVFRRCRRFRRCRMAASAALYDGLFVARLSRVLFSVAVEGLALWACTLCFPFSGARQRPLCPGPCALSCLCGKGRSPGRRSRPSNQRISQSANQPGAPMERPCLRGEGSHRSAYGRTQPQVHAISHAVLQGVVLFYGRKHECELLIFVSPIPPYRGPEAIRPGPFSGSRKKIKESACIL